MQIRLSRELTGLIALCAFLILIAISAPDFYSAGNLRDLALANVPVLLVATGMTLVIIVAQIDISVGSQFAVCSVVCGMLAKAGVPLPLLGLLVALAGGALGALNGTLIARVGVPSIVATLAAMAALREGLRWTTGGAWVQGLPSNFQWFGFGQGTGQAVIMLLAAAIFAAFLWASKNLAALRMVYATGSDTEAARLAGIRPQWVVFNIFLLMGLLTGVAAFLNAVRFNEVPSNAGVGLELKAIAAVVVGGTPITGGRGSLLGTLIGVILLGSIGPALIYMGINSYWEKAIQGGIILVTVLVDAAAGQAQKRLAVAA